jgi:predicted outer membrane protein
MRQLLITLGLATALAAAGTALAQDKAAKLDRADRNFMEKAAAAGMAEVETGKLAASKAQNPDIKAFGQQMVDDHSKANDELKALASQKGVQLPASLDRKHAGEMKKLEKLTGADFDREYIRNAGTRDHADARKLFQKAQKDAKDPDVKAFADKYAPVIAKHEEAARSLAGPAKK